MTSPYISENDYYGAAEEEAYSRSIPADEYYNAPVTEPQPAPVEANDDAVIDPNPALAGVGPQYGAADSEPEGVDMTTLPTFKDLRRMLPSERMKTQMATAKVAAALPAHLKNAEAGGLDFDSLTSDDLDALTNVIAAVESVVLDNATDREAMTEWLVTQDEPMNAVMAAFSQFTERLGN